MSEGPDRLTELDFLGRIPPTWFCIECCQEFPNGPTDPAPHAFKHERIPHDPRGGRRIVGDLCKSCHDRTETKP